MNFKDIEEAILKATNIAEKIKDPELTATLQTALDSCVAYREANNLEAPGMLTPEQDKELRDKTLQIAKRDEKLLGPLKEDHFGEEQAADLKKKLGTEGTDVNEPVTKDTGLSEQERWLIEALKDDPHDDRWED